MLISLIMNITIVVLTIGSLAYYFFDENRRFSPEKAKHHLVYFTIQSNIFCAVTALIMIPFAIGSMTRGTWDVPLWVTLLKYVGTVSVTVTFVTVMLFLGPTIGWGIQFAGPGIIVHAITPILAIVSYCFLERAYPLSFAQSLLGILPVLLYGLAYINFVVRIGEENGGWRDFYGFNTGGKWKISIAAMLTATFLLCVLLRAMHNAGM